MRRVHFMIAAVMLAGIACAPIEGAAQTSASNPQNSAASPAQVPKLQFAPGALLRAEYMLGFYPDGNAERAGWHSVVVGLSEPERSAGARLFCRPSYYIPAGK